MDEWNIEQERRYGMDDAQLYHLLFNAITDAIEAMEKMNWGQALEILKQSQQKSEEAYLKRAEE